MGSMIVMMLAVLAIMYFLMIRLENKKKKEAEQMRSAVKVGIRLPPSAAWLAWCAP